MSGTSARSIRSREVNAADIRSLGDVVGNIYDSELDLLLIRDAFPVEAITQAGQQLGEGSQDWFRPNSAIPGMDIQLLGVPGFPTAKAPAGPELETYLVAGDQYGPAIESLFGGEFSPSQRFEELLGALAAGRPTERPRTPDGRSFPPFTLRSLPEGQSIMVHVDYLFGLPLYQELAKGLDTRTLVSIFVVVQAPSEGGCLVVFELAQDDDVPRLKRGIPDQRTIEERYPSHPFAPGPGDMIVFPAGRFYHKVETVAGPLARVTLGGLFALSRDRSRVVYWG